VKYPVAEIEEADGEIDIRLYNHPEMEMLTSQEIIERCRKYEAFRITIKETGLHIVQLVHDLEQTGYKVTWIKPV
jgi:hypothetical protein